MLDLLFAGEMCLGMILAASLWLIRPSAVKSGRPCGVPSARCLRAGPLARSWGSTQREGGAATNGLSRDDGGCWAFTLSLRILVFVSPAE